jgi:hypothetical protein
MVRWPSCVDSADHVCCNILSKGITPFACSLFGGFGGGGFGGGQSADADVWGSLKRVEKLSAASFADKVQGPGNEMWLVLFYLPQSECYREKEPTYDRILS